MKSSLFGAMNLLVTATNLIHNKHDAITVEVYELQKNFATFRLEIRSSHLPKQREIPMLRPCWRHVGP